MFMDRSDVHGLTRCSWTNEMYRLDVHDPTGGSWTDEVFMD